ncbi:endonuclease/exonuclease/phosphatase family metal-dependent hydrolase [Geodermatophilus normandii]|uniref:Endonuclease/exonuclease/phosphatase family metal-dependent hydrolase n=1 Tax=Geodermatophilus normandii TaxID=1137989 RepID=A0A317QFC4_9ACTN|nr:endonuclease/exonuclease/phosphatase family protein [Geodermatophilus normandii]PWW22368.1 endonuclease/exonuclease/phosphatase family metal-dependent hydrolase [Geodermatophilus normandii]
MGASLRVLTMNVLGPANPDWERRSALVGETLRRLDADVVALQEVPVADGTVEALLGPGYTVTAFSRAADDGVGGVLATRAPHRVVEEIDQRCTPRARDFAWCATLVVEVDAAVGRTLVAHHKPSWQFGYEVEREQQALAAARALERLAGRADHAVVLGDLDAPPDAASTQFWRGRRSLGGTSVCYQDAWETLHPADPGFTFDARNPLVRAGEVATAVSRRIDWVLVRSGVHGPTLQVRSCTRVLDEPVGGVWASDHCGVVADLDLPASPPGSWDQQPIG